MVDTLAHAAIEPVEAESMSVGPVGFPASETATGKAALAALDEADLRARVPALPVLTPELADRLWDLYATWLPTLLR